MLRAFFALELPVEVQAAIMNWMEALKPQLTGVRWVGVDQLHLTLRFLGSITQGSLQQVIDRCTTLFQSSSPHVVEAVGTGIFPSLRRARVAWVGFGGEIEALIKLQAELEQALSGLDIHSEAHPKPFHPHVTIGRMKDPIKAAGIEQIILSGKDHHFGRVPVSAITLFQSKLTSKGATYTKLHTFELGE